ncbi:type VI secretion system domain-containing protein [Cronobacter malonaticus]|nr:type VI secretion system domain-containing protein [Cronobacter malonaticus]MEB8476853.1 type VI secretion system domain-containing protein [Cronobacter malonaticus]
MARGTEQFGKNKIALHLLVEVDGGAAQLTLTQWEPDLLFELQVH